MRPFDAAYANHGAFPFSPPFGVRFGTDAAIVLCAVIHQIERIDGEVTLSVRELHDLTGIKGYVALRRAKERLRQRGILIEKYVGPGRSSYSINEHLLIHALELA